MKRLCKTSHFPFAKGRLNFIFYLKEPALQLLLLCL